VSWNELVADALLAPSPHNTQPWLVRPVSETEAELYVDAARTLPATDSDGAFMTATLGIFVEALDVAAAARGLAVAAEPLFPKLGAGSDARPLFARLRLTERREPGPFARELLEQRRTARGAYDGRPADPAALEALASVAAEAGHVARFTSDADTVEWIVALNADTVFYDLDEDGARAEIGRWIRRSEREAQAARDGFSPRCLGFPGPLVSLFFFHHRLFASRPVRALLRRLLVRSMRGTASVGWFEGPWSTPQEQYEAGRMVLRFWLELTRHGLRLQPFGSVITNATAHGRLAERIGARERDGAVWLLLRIGYAPPPPRSRRLRPEDVVL
jgi:hypothetical protein